MDASEVRCAGSMQPLIAGAAGSAGAYARTMGKCCRPSRDLPPARPIPLGPPRLPPLSAQWEREPEPADEFRARLQGSIDYGDTDLKGSRHYVPPPLRAGVTDAQRAAVDEARAAAAAVTPSPLAAQRAVEYSLEPRLAAAYARGWETAREVDRRWDSGELLEVSGLRGPVAGLDDTRADAALQRIPTVAAATRRNAATARPPSSAGTDDA